jgi:hypothetical protein
MNHDLRSGSLREHVREPTMVDVMVRNDDPLYASGVDIVPDENSGQL